MAKEPRSGTVKTRLARDIGSAAAVRFSRKMTTSLLRRLRAPRRWQTVIAISPDRAAGSSAWPGGYARVPQGSGDLGVRMQRIFARMPPGPVVIVGTDIPEVRARHIADAFALLGSHDAVFGPARDGGYWLVGLRRSPRTQRIYSHVRWSGPETLADTLTNLEGSAVAMIDRLDDVDDGESYRRLAGAGGRVVLPPWWRPSEV
jgi:rSAM/selenodomain-associated transferase 1